MTKKINLSKQAKNNILICQRIPVQEALNWITAMNGHRNEVIKELMDAGNCEDEVELAQKLSEGFYDKMV